MNVTARVRITFEIDVPSSEKLNLPHKTIVAEAMQAVHNIINDPVRLTRQYQLGLARIVPGAGTVDIVTMVNAHQVSQSK